MSRPLSSEIQSVIAAVPKLGWGWTSVVAMTLVSPGAVADGPFLFGPPQVISMPTPHGPTMVAAGDLDGDGDPDLVVAGRNAEGLAYVVPNEGGVLGTPVELVTGGQTDWVEIADLDGDGHLDLCFAVRALRGRLSMLRGLGDGTFGEFEEIRLGREPRALVVDDLDGDGDPDIAAMNHRLPIVEILLNDGDGGFVRGVDVVIAEAEVGHPFPQAIDTTDIDRDGDRDLVVIATGASRACVVVNRGDGTFEPDAGWRPPRVAGEIGGMTSLGIGDVDSDGDEDLVVPLILIDSPSHLGVFENAGTPGVPALTRERAFPATQLGYAYAVGLGDLDGDHDLDAVVGHALPGPVMALDNRTIPVAEGGDGRVVFEPPQQIGSDSFFRSVLVVDVDGDCDQDVLAVELISNSIWFLPNLTPQEDPGCGGGFTARTASFPGSADRSTPFDFDRSAVGDLDGDGERTGIDVALFLETIGGDVRRDPPADRDAVGGRNR